MRHSAQQQITQFRAKPELNEIMVQLESVLLGKRHQIELAFACLLARGHLLIEDIPLSLIHISEPTRPY